MEVKLLGDKIMDILDLYQSLRLSFANTIRRKGDVLDTINAPLLTELMNWEISMFMFQIKILLFIRIIKVCCKIILDKYMLKVPIIIKIISIIIQVSSKILSFKITEEEVYIREAEVVIIIKVEISPNILNINLLAINPPIED